MKKPQSSRQVLEGVFRERTERLLDRLLERSTSRDLAEALEAPTDYGGLARFLSAAAPESEVATIDPLAESLVRGAEARQDLLERAGGTLGSGDAATILGLTRQAVDQRRRRNQLLAVQGGRHYLYPACQFTEDGVVPGLEEILEAFQVDDPWMRLAVLVTPTETLGDRSVIDALREGLHEEALEVVRAYAAE